MTGPEADVSHDDLGLVTLCEVGFIIKETDECICLSYEYSPGATSSRQTLAIPHSCLVARIPFDCAKLLRIWLRTNRQTPGAEFIKELLKEVQ